ncbi:MAG: hypothetical protein KC464_20845, partial [Myxococcales bacterium]|nr:hypothetical protein [Myxococcales bacterium]
ATPAAELTGTWERRYEQGGATCVVATPARAWGCQGHTLHLDVTPPAPPVDLAACVAGPAAPAVTWILRRE